MLTQGSGTVGAEEDDSEQQSEYASGVLFASRSIFRVCRCPRRLPNPSAEKPLQQQENQQHQEQQEQREEKQEIPAKATEDKPMIRPSRSATTVDGFTLAQFIRMKQTGHATKIMHNGLDMSQLTFEQMMGDEAQRASFRVYCESVHRTEFLNFLDSVRAFKASPSPNAGLAIWSDFLRSNTDTPVILEENSPILESLKRNHHV